MTCGISVLRPRIFVFSHFLWASLVAQLVKNLPAMWETWIWSLGWEDPLEKGTVIHSSILAWRIPWIVLSMGWKRVRHDWTTFTSFFVSVVFTSSTKTGPSSFGSVLVSAAQSCLTLCDPMDLPAMLLCPWDSVGKNPGVGCHFLLQGIFLT